MNRFIDTFCNESRIIMNDDISKTFNCRDLEIRMITVKSLAELPGLFTQLNKIKHDGASKHRSLRKIFGRGYSGSIPLNLNAVRNHFLKALAITIGEIHREAPFRVLFELGPL